MKIFIEGWLLHFCPDSYTTDREIVCGCNDFLKTLKLFSRLFFRDFNLFFLATLSSQRRLGSNNVLLRFFGLRLSSHLHFLCLNVSTTEYSEATKGFDANQVSIYGLFNWRNLICRLFKALCYCLLNRKFFARRRLDCLLRYPFEVSRGLGKETS